MISTISRLGSIKTEIDCSLQLEKFLVPTNPSFGLFIAVVTNFIGFYIVFNSQYAHCYSSISNKGVAGLSSLQQCYHFKYSWVQYY